MTERQLDDLVSDRVPIPGTSSAHARPRWPKLFHLIRTIHLGLTMSNPSQACFVSALTVHITVAVRALSLLLILNLTYFTPAQGTEPSPYEACTSSPKPAAHTTKPTEQIQLAEAIASEITGHLAQVREQMRPLQACLAGLQSWQDALPEGCDETSFRALFFGVVPRVLKEARVRLALSTSQNPYSQRLWSFEDVMNPNMVAPAFSPLNGRWQALTDIERQAAQKALLVFWDGSEAPTIPASQQALRQTLGLAATASAKAGVIQEYLDLLKRKRSHLRDGSPQARELEQWIEQFAETRKLQRAEDRVQKALLLGEANWKLYQQRRLEEFRRDHLMGLWNLVDAYRPLAYLPMARPKPADHAQALVRVAENNQLLAQKIEQQLGRIRQDPARHRSELFSLLEHHALTEKALQKRQDLCPTALALATDRDNRELLAMGTLGLLGVATLGVSFPAVAAGMGPTLTAMLISAAVASGGLTAYMSQQELSARKDAFFAHWTGQFATSEEQGEVSSAAELMALQNDATWMTVLGLSFGLPALKAHQVVKWLTLGGTAASATKASASP